ncbi:Flp family type IVb pilin [Chlorobaculum sp. 24CR]|uniref:Flp family type IVb pilin n=1 Tax=Chlorobaculum sp. 24CR TaxID=2508878 RepID=UPI00100BD74D|nr:Flp family type IVb pilin [Chlorobaculum sp. 24CR]RXK80027.1 Flp family type IVb pilin [Chlorobaculum sp. 24CR]
MSNMFVAIKLLAAAMSAKLSERFGIESQKGVTMIEYALVGALIAAALVSSLTVLKGNIAGLFTNIGNNL